MESEYIPGLHVRVTGAQHRGKTGRLLLAPAFLARFLKVPMIAHRFQGPFTVDLLFQSPQGLLHGFAFFQFNFGQTTFTSSPETFGLRPAETTGAPL